MIRITDKSFRYTNSFNTDLRKKFRKMEHKRRAVMVDKRDSEIATDNSVVSMMARRSMPKI